MTLLGVSLVFKRVKEESDRLERLLERALRYITKDFSSPYHTLKNKVGIASRRIQDMLIIIFKALSSGLHIFKSLYLC